MCISAPAPFGCCLMAGEVFLRHHEVWGAQSLPEVSGLVLLHPQVLRKSSPSHLFKQTAPTRQWELGAGVGMCSSPKWRRRSVPIARLKNHVGGRGAQAEFCRYRAKQKSGLCWIYPETKTKCLNFTTKSLKKKKKKKSGLLPAATLTTFQHKSTLKIT